VHIFLEFESGIKKSNLNQFPLKWQKSGQAPKLHFSLLTIEPRYAAVTHTNYRPQLDLGKAKQLLNNKKWVPFR